jgi:hypothetical protein
MTLSKREALIEKIRLQGVPSSAGKGPPTYAQESLPVVSLEDFFEGNQDYGSIGCNLMEHPSPQVFFEHLLSIRARPDVQDVLVEISEVEEDNPNRWPFSERVYILTSTSAEQVAEWMALLKPDEIERGYLLGKPSAAPRLQEGMEVYAAWWD